MRKMGSDADVYRSAASILVLRIAVDGSHQLLLLHKPRKNDAWQLPQGGAEAGESTEQTAVRELFEEAGIRGEVIGRSEHVYCYDFPESYRRFRPDNVCGQKIGFVFAVAPADVQVRVDDKEVDAHAWIGIDDLDRYIERREYRELVRELYGEAVELWMRRQRAEGRSQGAEKTEGRG